MLPVPCWVSYAAHAAIAGKRVIGVPIGAEAGGVPDPAQLRAALAEAEGIGARPGVLVLTLPDNPTGTVASAEVVREVCEIAEAAGLLIVCDEIYRDLAYEPERFVSPAEVLPERTFVTTGLSKHLALGGWRVGLVRLADGPLGEQAGAALGGLASEIWSALAGADAARGRVRARRAAGGRRARRREPPPAPRGEPRRLRGRDRRRRALPAAERRLLPLSRLHGAALRLGRRARRPPARGAQRRRARRRGVRRRPGGAALPHGHEPALRRRATSSKREALASDDPVSLPWIAAALDRMRAGFAA